MPVEIERCWICCKIVPKPTNPPDVHAEDLCCCLGGPEETVEDRIEDRIAELEERIDGPEDRISELAERLDRIERERKIARHRT